MKGEVRLVGITGRKQAGKDTFARVLMTQAGFTRVGLADALKEDLAHLLGVTPDYVEEHKEDLRLALQLRATEYWRAREPKHWITEADDRVDRVIACGGKAVVPDIRFLLDAEWIQARGGVMVRIIRLAGEHSLAAVNHHVSETEQDRIPVDLEFSCKTGVHHVEGAARIFLRFLMSRANTDTTENSGRM